MSETYRTPETQFDAIEGFDYEPVYTEISGLRLAHIEAGSGPTVLLVHGEPTWSYLWRKVIPPLVDAGFRVVAPDLVGFGRSDKPVEFDWYTYDKHCTLFASHMEAIGIEDATIVVHDWGGPIGLRFAVEHANRISRLVLLDTGLFTGTQKMTDLWLAFKDFVAREPDMPIGFLVKGGCATDPGEEVIAAYEAPFPEVQAKAGARAFPTLIPFASSASFAAATSGTRSAIGAECGPLNSWPMALSFWRTDFLRTPWPGMMKVRPT